MGYLLGILPEQSTRYKIRSWLGDVGEIFESQNIPIGYVERNSYHITLLYLGDNVSLINRKLIPLKLRNYSKSQFDIGLNSVRLGISRKRKDLLFIPVVEGANELREIVYELSNALSFRGSERFIPHITLGRVRKDLSDQEFRNLTESVSKLNQSELLKNITFRAENFSLLRFTPEGYKELKRFKL